MAKEIQTRVAGFGCPQNKGVAQVNPTPIQFAPKGQKSDAKYEAALKRAGGDDTLLRR